MTNKKKIAIDFDGVICKEGRENEPVKGALEGLMGLYEEGYEVVIFTVREDTLFIRELIIDWYNYEHPGWLIPPFEITNKKPAAIAYIDDRAIRFRGNWRDILNYF